MGEKIVALRAGSAETARDADRRGSLGGGSRAVFTGRSLSCDA